MNEIRRLYAQLSVDEERMIKEVKDRVFAEGMLSFQEGGDWYKQMKQIVAEGQIEKVKRLEDRLSVECKARNALEQTLAKVQGVCEQMGEEISQLRRKVEDLEKGRSSPIFDRAPVEPPVAESIIPQSPALSAAQSKKNGKIPAAKKSSNKKVTDDVLLDQFAQQQGPRTKTPSPPPRLSIDLIRKAKHELRVLCRVVKGSESRTGQSFLTDFNPMLPEKSSSRPRMSSAKETVA